MVSNRDEILDNVEVFLEGLEGENEAHRAKALQMIKSSNVFLAILSEEVNFFIPSTFLAVKDENFETFDTNRKDEDILPIVNPIMGSTPKIDKTMDELFLDFCDEVEINRNDVGLSREYWIIKDL